MTLAVLYLAGRFSYRFVAFFRHWYLDSLRVMAEFWNRLLRRLDQTLALRVTLRHFFQPLYQDRSFIGYVFGFGFRSARVFIASIIYFLIVVIAVSIYLFWAALPAYAVFNLMLELI
ncbi:MAG: hypothetical protein HYS89_01490 [Candidatus Colwellbacteria bacterium]|nr:hypothetical protein [Candidatus Colwellbacteria bacterium]